MLFTLFVKHLLCIKYSFARLVLSQEEAKHEALANTEDPAKSLYMGDDSRDSG